MDSATFSGQIVRLTRQEAQAQHICVELFRCRDELHMVWSGQDGTEVYRALGEIIRRCGRLADQLRELRRDMVWAGEAVAAAGPTPDA